MSAAFQFRLDGSTGVPVYRQLIDQVLGAIAAGALRPGDQLPTVRQVAVDLAINPNTVVRSYRELEIRGFLATQQGTGTFITDNQVKTNEVERQRRLTAVTGEFMARLGREGFSLEEGLRRLEDLRAEQKRS